jgi:nucleoid-associated protein YgaU
MLEIAIVTACVALPSLPAAALDAPGVSVAPVADQPVVRALVAVAPADAAPVPRATPLPTLRREASDPAHAGPSILDPARVGPARVGPARVGPARVGPARVIVRPGDNLWLIARVALERGSVARIDDSAVARYWQDVIGANRSTLRSGDPSLVFPGEIIALPPAPRGVS